MAMDPTFAKLIGIVVVGSVAKTLLGPPPAPVTHVHNHNDTPKKENP